tara:strand:+ start:956 stop:1546 length:591 start_codon:yes stop_codon:yes gene_type:complete
MKFNKAAMFGLDARIALAIFGALSVISGAALYSAIQQSKVTALVTEMTEIGKAVEQYYLDTGQLLPIVSVAGNTRNVWELVENTASITGWNGPYLTYKKGSDNTQLVHPVYGPIKVFSTRTTTWADFTGASIECLTSKLACDIWVVFHDINDSLMSAVETYLDDTSAPGTTNFEGKFRYSKTNSDGGMLVGISHQP